MYQKTPTSNKIIATLILIASGLTASCSSSTPSIESHHIRDQAVQESALRYGAQSGLAWRVQRIKLSVQQHEEQLDQIFDFSAMLLPNHLLPPVLQESRNNLNLATADSIRLSDRIIEIVQPAHFVTTTPRWQNYLSLHFTKPELPNKVMLPQTQQEREIWDTYVLQGWNQGTQQAGSIFREDLGKLVRDMQGMALYRGLLAQNMVSPPYVANSKLGVTGDSGKMRLNDQVMRITAHSNLLPQKSNTWKPAVVADHNPSQ